MKKRWMFIIIFLVILFLFTSFIAGIVSLFVETEEPITGNVALIPIQGVIMTTGDSFYGQDIASSDKIVKNIKKADESKNIKAIILEINSGGGTAVASEEVVNAIKKTNKTTVAYIREIGASGAYWIASSTDNIFASRMSITGSVGVIGSYLEFSGLLDRYNITYQRMVAGKYKDLGSPLKDITNEEESILQKQLDLIHDYFLQDVIESRGLKEDQIRKVSTAQIFLGVEAKDLNLIDDFGGKEEATSYIEEKINISADLKEFRESKSFLDVLSGVMNEKSFYVGKGIGSQLLTQKNSEVKVWT